MKKGILFWLLLLSLPLFAEKITVTADRFEAFEKKHISILTGHVHVTKGKDDIKADKLIIDFDTHNKPKRYTLTGHVTFDIATRSQHFRGNAQKIVYDPSQKQYIATGNVVLHEINSDKTLQGEKIIIDRISGKTSISGKHNRPVKFTFTVEE